MSEATESVCDRNPKVEDVKDADDTGSRVDHHSTKGLDASAVALGSPAPSHAFSEIRTAADPAPTDVAAAETTAEPQGDNTPSVVEADAAEHTITPSGKEDFLYFVDEANKLNTLLESTMVAKVKNEVFPWLQQTFGSGDSERLRSARKWFTTARTVLPPGKERDEINRAMSNLHTLTSGIMCDYTTQTSGAKSKKEYEVGQDSKETKFKPWVKGDEGDYHLHIDVQHAGSQQASESTVREALLQRDIEWRDYLHCGDKIKLDTANASLCDAQREIDHLNVVVDFQSELARVHDENYETCNQDRRQGESRRSWFSW